jgi:transcriptional regulator with XRE-family HTH domain
MNGDEPMIELTRQRKKRGLSQRRLAALLDLYSDSTICRWESGSSRRPYARTAEKLELVFGLTIDELFAPVTTKGDVSKDTALGDLPNQQERKNRYDGF